MLNRWRQYAVRTRTLEKRYAPQIKKLIKNFRSQLISDIHTHGIHAAQANLHQANVPELPPLLTEIYAQAGLLGARITAQEIRQMVTQKDLYFLWQAYKAAKSAPFLIKQSDFYKKANGFGQNERWIRDVQDYLKIHLLDFTQDITETMKADILKVIDKGVAEGWGIDRIVSELQRQDLVAARAEVIARTEINRAANVGHSIAARSLPYEVDKKWISAHDHRTRHSHLIADGHQTDENGFFDVPIFKGDVQMGVDQMSFPGDPTASASNTINCRCRVIYIPKRDSLGRLVLREANQATIIPLRRPRQMPIEQIAATLKDSVHIGVNK